MYNDNNHNDNNFKNILVRYFCGILINSFRKLTFVQKSCTSCNHSDALQI